ncbi:DUF1761 domain-containing protein [Mesorhizobium sp. VK24D]|uniref:DUF1761 domain-containing protein n=1 Tax=Mesorhizobium album TaxID=3072314 RepID=A0ABU4Y969_9HYPH|nr:DUF1761 domain-containing protein [Mesorhizobium sp. VK24D]MDX8483482.1 DUF1761 domain-containing protein [Mesorhizobium sp. VK24D]
MSGVDGTKFAAGLPRASAVDLASFAAMALIPDQVLHAWSALTIVLVLLCTSLLWLGFIAVVLLHSATYEHRSPRYYAVNAGYRLVSMTVMGVVLTVMRRQKASARRGATKKPQSLSAIAIWTLQAAGQHT